MLSLLLGECVAFLAIGRGMFAVSIGTVVTGYWRLQGICSFHDDIKAYAADNEDGSTFHEDDRSNAEDSRKQNGKRTRG